MSDAKKIMEMIKEHDAKFVDFRFTDPRGKWQHLTYHVKAISADVLAEGVMFDGSSIAGWKVINESDTMVPIMKTLEEGRASGRSGRARPAHHG